MSSASEKNSSPMDELLAMQQSALQANLNKASNIQKAVTLTEANWMGLTRAMELTGNSILKAQETLERLPTAQEMETLLAGQAGNLTAAHTEAVLERLSMIVALRNRSPEAAQSLMRHLFLELMEEEAAAGRFRFSARRRSDERIARALAFIHENFAGSIGVADMAAAVRLGEVQFRKLFRHEVGMGPAAYLQRARLIHAARLLARYDLPLGEVARRSGFSGECYFSTLFRSVFARTPGQYRRYIRGR